ncbi:hypothetical protein POM88_012297 [Heracleum sosnowskyi]|uniref:Cyclic nucleotide-binding domain-containing protein n=1 Tax=Heracleum sosnowskyi TaxID=360622 RepID=A0AAD8N272_9APIA|nr:hypothetical protein POM88_012297 [Heracleum sosnowskyi]
MTNLVVHGTSKTREFRDTIQAASRVSNDLLFQLVSEMKSEYFPPNEDVILQNEAPTDFYTLVTGAIDLLVLKNGVVGEAKNGDLWGQNDHNREQTNKAANLGHAILTRHRSCHSILSSLIFSLHYYSKTKNNKIHIHIFGFDSRNCIMSSHGPGEVEN